VCVCSRGASRHLNALARTRRVTLERYEFRTAVNVRISRTDRSSCTLTRARSYALLVDDYTVFRIPLTHVRFRPPWPNHSSSTSRFESVTTAPKLYRERFRRRGVWGLGVTVARVRNSKKPPKSPLRRVTDEPASNLPGRPVRWSCVVSTPHGRAHCAFADIWTRPSATSLVFIYLNRREDLPCNNVPTTRNNNKRGFCCPTRYVGGGVLVAFRRRRWPRRRRLINRWPSPDQRA